jgi:hypothetical protein
MQKPNIATQSANEPHGGEDCITNTSLERGANQITTSRTVKAQLVGGMGCHEETYERETRQQAAESWCR